VKTQIILTAAEVKHALFLYAATRAGVEGMMRGEVRLNDPFFGVGQLHGVWAIVDIESIHMTKGGDA
jgi:hypothetical protein